MASELRVTTIANNAGSESVDSTYVINGSAKAWAATLSDSAVAADSLNISSITDLGSGDNRPIWSSAFSNANYSVVASSVWTSPVNRTVSTNAVTASQIELQTYTADSGNNSSVSQNFMCAGDLA